MPSLFFPQNFSGNLVSYRRLKNGKLSNFPRRTKVQQCMHVPYLTPVSSCLCMTFSKWRQLHSWPEFTRDFFVIFSQMFRTYVHVRPRPCFHVCSTCKLFLLIVQTERGFTRLKFQCLVVCWKRAWLFVLFPRTNILNNNLVADEIQEYAHVFIGQSMKERFIREQQSKLG